MLFVECHDVVALNTYGLTDPISGKIPAAPVVIQDACVRLLQIAGKLLQILSLETAGEIAGFAGLLAAGRGGSPLIFCSMNFMHLLTLASSPSTARVTHPSHLPSRRRRSERPRHRKAFERIQLREDHPVGNAGHPDTGADRFAKGHCSPY